MKKSLRKLTVHRETLTRMESSGTAAGALTGAGSNPNHCFHTAEPTCFGCIPTGLTPNCSIYCTATL